MFQNNNYEVIRNLSKKSFRANKSRNMYVIIALILTTFMITSVFSIGFSYTKTNQQQQIRMMGTTAHAAITNVTEEQIEQIEHEFSSVIGISQRLGTIESNKIGDALLGLGYIDKTEWETHRKPAITGVKGKYPTQINEVMLPTWVLKKMGIEKPKIGMKIQLGYRLTTGQEIKNVTFLLAGYYTDYMQIRTQNRGTVYVSEAFCKETDISLENGGTAMISFTNDENIARSCEQLKSRVELEETQSFEIVPIYVQSDNSMTIILAGAVAVMIAAGYLLIYNILYISVSKDIRSYGQLKTLGTTKRQIKRLIRLQVFKNSIIGIPIGLLAGAVVSFGIVPFFLNVFSPGDASLGVSISFSPFVFIFAGLFSFLTVFLASMKPARIAASIAPVEAMKFTGVKSSRIKSKITKGGVNVAYMAWRNIFRRRKSAVLVLTSLFLGLTLFLLSTGIFGSLSPQNFVTEYLQSDIVVTQLQTATKERVTQEMVDEIETKNGVIAVSTTNISAPNIDIPVNYMEETYGQYIESLADNPEIKSNIDFKDPQVIKSYLDYFSSFVYGIDTLYAEELKSVDLEAFENGDIVLLRELYDKSGNNLFQAGKKIELVSKQTGVHRYKIGGFLEENFQNSTDRGSAPSIYMSKAALQKLSPDNQIGRLDIKTDRKNDGNLILEIKSVLGNSSDVQISSRYEKEQEIAGYILTCKIMGMGVSVILLLIGVMNFINTMMVGVTSRKQEFAVLESIGMTSKQVRKMLVLEGFYYFLISFALLDSIGSGIFAGVFCALKRVASYAVFTYPALPIIAAAVVILVVCISVPLAAYQSSLSESVVERLRNE